MITTIFTKPVLRFTSVFLTVVILAEFIVPISAYALTSGPTQPEFSSFEPVATSNMVDNFTGAFNYNLPVIEIPGPHGSSYPISLSYHSGATPEDEASWVGYGWNINPGAINRSVRGYPDDDLGVKIDKYMNTGEDITASCSIRGGVEVTSVKAGLGLSLSLRYNNHKGFAFGYGIDANFAGAISVGYNVDDGTESFSFKIDPLKVLEVDKGGSKKGAGENSVLGIVAAEGFKAAQSAMVSYAMDVLNRPSYPIPMQEFTGKNVSFSTGGTGSFSIGTVGPIGGHGGGSATYSSFQTMDKHLSAYGYMYSGIAQTQRLCGDYGKDKSNRSVSMDYYKERYAPYEAHQKYMPIPFNNPDNYAVTGEGIGGVFRFHHREIGTNLPEYSMSTKKELGLSQELTAGTQLGISPYINIGQTELSVSPGNDHLWADPSGDTPPVYYAIIPPNPSDPNDKFKQYSTDAPYRNFTIPETKHPSSLNVKDEGVFPRFMGDLGGSVVFDQDLGTLSSPTYDKVRTPSQFDNTSMRIMNSSKRAGRSSNISYNTIGSMRAHPDFCYTKDEDTRKYIFPQEPGLRTNDQNYLPDNAIGEFAVYLPDGKCYVYGLPVLARKENRRNYLQNPYKFTGEYREAPYATKYLLTQILTPDYIDVDGDGPSVKDLGGWIKFSYNKCSIPPTTDPNRMVNEDGTWAKWKIPFKNDTYYYERGKVIDNTDDRYSESRGEKQVYVLEKAETASHVAYFVTNRTDAKYYITSTAFFPITGSGIERADAYQYGFSNGTHNAFLGNWNSLWPTPLSKGTYPTSTPHTSYYVDYEITQSKIPDENVTLETTRQYPNFSQTLERIELYKKGDPKQIKTVRFDYDYSSFAASNGRGTINCTDLNYKYTPTWTNEQGDVFPMPPDPCADDPDAIIHKYGFPLGLPNSAMYPCRHTNDPTKPDDYTTNDGVIEFKRYGKLTLKKVWFEYGEIANAKISPYVFEYYNPKTDISGTDLGSKYPNVLNYGKNYDTATYRYSDLSQDSWGYYSIAPGLVHWRNFIDRRWNSQRENNFDPAPFHLKVIKLPSGGEIRVQYEGHDYEYVQDRPAMAMVSLSGVDEDIPDVTRYFLNIAGTAGDFMSDFAAPLSGDRTEKSKVVERIKNHFLTTVNGQTVCKEKIAFKFLYSFDEEEPIPANSNDYNAMTRPWKRKEYIQGYCNVKDVGICTTEVNAGQIYIDVTEDRAPDKTAQEYYETNISGVENQLKKGTVLQTVIDFIQKSPNVTIVVPEVLRVFNKFSYFRIPLPQPKKAGGCRVKRVLMYDSGDDASTNNEDGKVIYGQEYIYKTLDEHGNVISSGVATNEPPEMKIENSLVTYMEKYNETSWIDKPVAGRYLDNYEGPLGESILPGPSIGYSSVIVRNIHSGKTTPGFTKYEYYTNKDYPFIKNVQFTNLAPHIDKPAVHITIPYYSQNEFSESASQGYCFSLNSMHGQPRRTTQYALEFNSGTTLEDKDFLKTEKTRPVETTEYSYFEQGEKLPLFYDKDTPIGYSLNGVEIEISHESNIFYETRDSRGIEVDVGISLPIPPFSVYFGMGTPTIGQSDTKLTSSVVSKIIKYPCVLKKVTTTRDGMTHTVENIAFSPYTGQPLVRMVSDEFDGTQPSSGSVLTGTTTIYEIPAASMIQYKVMGQKSENERFALTGTNESPNFFLVYSSISPFVEYAINIVPPNSPLYPGDIIMFQNSDGIVTGMRVINGRPNTYDIGTDTYTPATDPLIGNLYYTIGSLEIGSAFPNSLGSTSKMIVIRSGKTNQLSAVAGTVALYGKTKDEILAPTATLTTLSAAGVLSASATKYSDDWDYSWVGGYPTSTDTSAYESGRRGKWRPMESYVYRDEATLATGGSNRIYGNSGTMAAFTMFDWESTSNGVNWLRTNSVSHYSKHGEPVEEKDINNIYSSARFSHQDAVPSMVASNAQYLDMYFESYEDKSGSTGFSQTKAHTGTSSRKLTGSSSTEPTPFVWTEMGYK